MRRLLSFQCTFYGPPRRGWFFVGHNQWVRLNETVLRLDNTEIVRQVQTLCRVCSLEIPCAAIDLKKGVQTYGGLRGIFLFSKGKSDKTVLKSDKTVVKSDKSVLKSDKSVMAFF
jgi:hypothetical protein